MFTGLHCHSSSAQGVSGCAGLQHAAESRITSQDAARAVGRPGAGRGMSEAAGTPLRIWCVVVVHGCSHNQGSEFTGVMELPLEELAARAPETTRIYARVEDKEIQQAHRKAFEK